MKMRMFPVTDMMTQVGGCICDSGGFHTPSEDKGALIYLNANPDVQNVLNRIEAAGGKNHRAKNRNFARVWLHGRVY